MKPAVEWISRPSRPRDDLALEPRDEVVGQPDPLERRAEHELARVQDEGPLLVDLDELGQVLLRLLDVDVRVARVVEHAEEAVDADVDARRLEQRLVVRIDPDPALVEQPRDGSVGKDHAAILSCSLRGPLRLRPEPPARDRVLRARTARVRGLPGVHASNDGRASARRRRGGRRRGRDVHGDRPPAAGRPSARRLVHARLVLAAPRRAHAVLRASADGGVARLPPLGVRERGARPRAAPGWPNARREPSGASPRPVTLRHLEATRRSAPPTSIRAWLDLYPELRFKLDPTSEWTDELVADLAATGAIDSVDLKGQYEGTVVDQPPDRCLYQRVVDAFPDAWVEDPNVNDETRPILEPHAARITWDAPIHSVDGHRALSLAPRRSTSSRRASAPSSGSSTPTTTAPRASSPTAKASGSSRPGRGQIQYLAALFHPDTRTTSRRAATTRPEPQPGYRTARSLPETRCYGLPLGRITV